MIVFLAYLSASWSRWQTDLAFGLLAGALLGVAQDLAAGSRVGWGHVTAFALALGLGLVLIRGLAAILPVWANVAIVTAVISVVIGVVDYGLLRGEDV
jgi:predicted membrane channel-forming protein YqfA (hemolysin III family)